MCLCATVNIRNPATLKNDSKKSEKYGTFTGSRKGYSNHLNHTVEHN